MRREKITAAFSSDCQMEECEKDCSNEQWRGAYLQSQGPESSQRRLWKGNAGVTWVEAGRGISPNRSRAITCAIQELNQMCSSEQQFGGVKDSAPEGAEKSGTEAPHGSEDSISGVQERASQIVPKEPCPVEPEGESSGRSELVNWQWTGEVCSVSWTTEKRAEACARHPFDIVLGTTGGLLVLSVRGEQPNTPTWKTLGCSWGAREVWNASAVYVVRLLGESLNILVYLGGAC